MKVYIVKVGFSRASMIKGVFVSPALADAWLERNWGHYFSAHRQKVEPSQGPEVLRYEFKATIRDDYAAIEEHDAQGAA